MGIRIAILVGLHKGIGSVCSAGHGRMIAASISLRGGNYKPEFIPAVEAEVERERLAWEAYAKEWEEESGYDPT